MFSPASVDICVREQLSGANSSPIVTKLGQSYPGGDYILEGQGQRSRSVGEVCALLSLSSFVHVLFVLC